MILVLSDTHSRQQPQLTPNLRSAVEDADLVVHAGDFTTAAVYSYFQGLAEELVAATGNRDRSSLREKLPEERTVSHGDLTLTVTHGHRHDSTSLSMLARQEGADIVVVGHSHQPVVEKLGEQTLLNPGSHADPRGNQPAYATIEQDGAATTVSLKTPAGELLETKTV